MSNRPPREENVEDVVRRCLFGLRQDLINIIADAMEKADRRRARTTAMQPQTKQGKPTPLAYTLDEASKILNIHRRTLDRYVKEGKGPKVFRMGVLPRVTHTALMTWIEARSGESAE